MPISLPKRPNVRHCTHIKVTGQQCGSPALRGEFFCYFHTRVIKGVQQRVDMQMHSMALLEDCESIQLSIMHVVDGLLKGTLEQNADRHSGEPVGADVDRGAEYGIGVGGKELEDGLVRVRHEGREEGRQDGEEGRQDGKEVGNEG